ncbi:MAG: hypothetical protein PHE88_06185 [Elusimicrobia bacterium]|nr:hypothetical protein [Elusimicrobiota bacterium]
MRSKRNVILLIIIFSAIIVGIGVSFAFGNTVNPNAPSEVKQSIEKWDSGLDERNDQNQSVEKMSLRGSPTRTTEAILKQDCRAIARNDNTADANLRTLFLSSLITLTFNTPIHSQIEIVKKIQKLYTVARHYFGLPISGLGFQVVSAVFTTIKRFFEKLIVFLLGYVVVLNLIFSLSIFQSFKLSNRLYYKFQNLRL